MNRFLTLTGLAGLGLSLAVLDATLKGTLLLLAAALTVCLLKKQSAAVRHLIWTGTLGLLLALPLLSALLPGWGVLPSWMGVRAAEPATSSPVAAGSESTRDAAVLNPIRDEAAMEIERPAADLTSLVVIRDAAEPKNFEPRTATEPSLVETTVLQRETGSDPVAEEDASFGVYSQMLIAAWLCGVLLLAARLVNSLWQLRRHCQRAEAIDSGPLFEAFESCRRNPGLALPVRLLMADGCMPMAWGILRPCVVLPKAAAEWSESQLRTVLMHELGHVARRDPLWQLVSQMAVAVYWFHPGVWLAAWRVQVERERACDDLVLNSGVRAADYARHLLDVVSEGRLRRMGVALGVAMSPQKNLEGRVRSILESNCNRSSVSKASLAVGVAAGILAVVPLSMLQAEASSKEPSGEPVVIDQFDETAAQPASTLPSEKKPQTPPPASSETESAADEGSGSEGGDKAPENGAGQADAKETVTFSGFDLTDYEFTGDSKSLSASGGPLNRSPSVADGGYFRARLQRDRWQLYYSPKKQHFYLQQRGPNSSTYYGPISGDAIERLKLVKEIAASINRDRKAEQPNPDGLGTLQNLIKSGEPSLAAAGLRILASVETIEVYEEKHFRQWVEGTKNVLAKTPAAKELYETSIAVMQRHKDRIEKLKMEIPADQYKPGRAATEAERAAGWGEEVDGLRMALIPGEGETPVLTSGKIAETSLLLRNVSDKPIHLSTMDGLDSVSVTVINEATKKELQVRFPFHFFSRSISRFVIAPGEVLTLKKPRYWVTQKGVAKPANSQKHSFAARLDVTPGQEYRMTVRLSLPGVFSKDGEGKISVPAKGEYFNDLTSGSASFAVAAAKPKEADSAAEAEPKKSPVVKPASQIQRAGRKVSLLGVDLTPHRFNGDWLSLFRPGAPLDREVPIAHGGRWSYAVPNRTWYVYYSPIRKVSYVKLRDSGEEYFGPIEGDGMKLFGLEEFLSDAANAQDAENRRVSSEELRAIERLISSEEPSLVASGFRALLRVKRLTINEEPRVRAAVEGAIRSLEDEAAMTSLRKPVAAYVAMQRADIEKRKVLLPDSQYQSGRAPTMEELAAGWGPGVDGLSVAVFPWNGLLPTMMIGERVKADLLVRNVSDSPKKISTLAGALDGVSAVVTDEKTKHSALLSFTLFTGISPSQRVLLNPGEVVRFKQPHFSIAEGDLHPPGRKFNAKSRQFMYDRILVRSDHTYRVEFQLHMPSATSHREGRITLPARGEFHGRLEAPPLRFKVQ